MTRAWGSRILVPYERPCRAPVRTVKSASTSGEGDAPAASMGPGIGEGRLATAEVHRGVNRVSRSAGRGGAVVGNAGEWWTWYSYFQNAAE